MTKKFKLLRSLNSKMVYALLLSALFALLLFFILQSVGGLLIDKFYMNPESVESRKIGIYNRFSAYVAMNHVSGSDQQAIARWTGENDEVSILVYKGQALNMRVSGGKAEPASNMQQYEQMRYASQYGKLYPMRFADGIYQIAINEDSVRGRERLCTGISILLSAVLFISFMLVYIKRLTSRIIKLSQQAIKVGGGDLDSTIHADGDDELSTLGREMDNMRCSVIERMGNERRAWEANSELITAISHDIRTPMTAMIGYLGLLNEGDYTSEEQRQQYTSSAYDKAMELKELTDELFKYFLVFGKSDLDMKMECFDARLLMDQLLGEAIFDLEELGFKINRIDFKGECSICADPMYLKRVIDNIVSNIKKYAEKSKVIVCISELKDDMLSVCVSNTIRKSLARVESTKIGLRTCRKILDEMGGEFITRSDEEHFSAELSLPAGPAEDAQ